MDQKHNSRDDPPPYTAELLPPASSASTPCSSPVVVTLRHRKPSPLQNSRGCKIARSGVRDTSISEPVLLSSACQDEQFEVLAREVRERTRERLPLSCSLVKAGKILLVLGDRAGPNVASGDREGRANDRAIKVDARNWTAVRLLLGQGKGQLVFEVVDVPLGWTPIEAKAKKTGGNGREAVKGKEKRGSGSKGGLSKENGRGEVERKKAECCVM